ncbi:hypothetical protein Ancab_017209 [Ancistrocladus abbreviatus]
MGQREESEEEGGLETNSTVGKKSSFRNNKSNYEESTNLITPNPNSTPIPLRRSTRRNPNSDLTLPAFVAGEDDEDQLSGQRREKQLKLLELPNSSLDSGSLNSGSGSNAEDDNTATTTRRKRKGAKSDDGPSTTLPDKKLLLFILDRLQNFRTTMKSFSIPWISVPTSELEQGGDAFHRCYFETTMSRPQVGGSERILEVRVSLIVYKYDVVEFCSRCHDFEQASYRWMVVLDVLRMKEELKAIPLEKYGFKRLIGKVFPWLLSGDSLSHIWTSITGSSLKGIPVKHGKKRVIWMRVNVAHAHNVILLPADKSHLHWESSMERESC